MRLVALNPPNPGIHQTALRARYVATAIIPEVAQ